ncbi:hypothetical protein [Armatimonas sp.]|uniref:hypothetical protein n=1 Tax=Armatimonas sp. TaxID=1872638 RepID=UPI00374CED80
MEMTTLNIDITALNPKFSLGKIVATQKALQLIQENGGTPTELIGLHGRTASTVVKGIILLEDSEFAPHAIDGHPVHSYFGVGTKPIFVVTEADRSRTTIHLPEEC